MRTSRHRRESGGGVMGVRTIRSAVHRIMHSLVRHHALDFATAIIGRKRKKRRNSVRNRPKVPTNVRMSTNVGVK